MTPAIVAAASNGEIPRRPLLISESERACYYEAFELWGRSATEFQWCDQTSTSLADLAASVLPDLTRNRSLSTLILATATHDTHPTTQPSVAVLREHIAHDRAIDLPAAWSITEQGMLAPLTALRVGCRRTRRLTGDVVVIAADRVGLPYPAEVSRSQQIVSSAALGVVIVDSPESYSVAVAPYADFAKLLVEAIRIGGPIDRVVLGGIPAPEMHIELAELDKVIDHVEPGQPCVGVLARLVSHPGRVLVVIADPDQRLVGVASICVRSNS